MKKFLSPFYLIPVLLCLFIGCSDDNAPMIETKPEFTEIVTQLFSLPGQTFTIKAKVEDAAGLETINLNNDKWFLNKDISFDSLVNSYDLAYRFKVPDSEVTGSMHTIKLTAINKAGVVNVVDVTVTLSMDMIAPTIAVLAPADGASILMSDGSAAISFDVRIKDDNKLQYFTLSGAGFNDSIALDSESYQYVNSFEIIDIGSFRFVLTAADSANNITTSEVSVNVIDELTFDKMYITEYGEEADLITDLFGVPVLTNNSTEIGKEGKVFTARYYASSPNTEVRFLPQKSSFEPFTFGADTEEGVLALGADATVNPIVLPEVGYYEITMNLLELTYSVVPYTVSDTPFDMVQLVGTGVKVNGNSVCTKDADNSTLCWHFQSGKELTKDPNNPYRFTATIELFDAPETEGVNGFLMNASKAGWNPFWRFDDGSNPEGTVFNAGSPFVFEADAYGTYHFVFDTHLNHVSVIPQ